jgi:hypothetical protein
VGIEAVATQAMTLCSCVHRFLCFLGVYCLHVHCQTWSIGHIAEDCSLKVTVLLL